MLLAKRFVMKPGNTKLIRLKNIEKFFDVNCELYAKDESTNPSGSIKDRAVYQMLLDYIEDGTLKKGGTVVEATSGNTGIAISYFSKEFDYKAVIVMPSSMSKQRREMIAQYGAELVLIDGGMKQANEKALEIVKNTKDAFIFNQFKNPSNPKAHYLYTAKEIDEKLPDVDFVFGGIGTGGTVSGIARYFKENKKNVKVVGVEPFESPLLTSGVAGPHKIQGIGANFIPDTLDQLLVKKVVDVKGDEAIEMAKLIHDKEGIYCGISSGAALRGAINYLKNNKIENRKAVIIFPDSGNRYSWS